MPCRVRRFGIVHRLAVALGVEIERQRQAHWTENVAVGGRGFVTRMQRELGPRGYHRAIETIGDTQVLRDEAGVYPAGLAIENDAMDAKSA